MVFISVLRVISILVAVVGTTFVFPILTSVFCHEYSVTMPFVITMIAGWVICCAINIPCIVKKEKFFLKQRSTFLTVALSWVCISLYGAIPLYFSHCTANFSDALFECISGFSTTGVTVFTTVNDLPRSINLYRCMMLWLGGMGVVALTVALLPLLGVGGFQLIKAETTGPEKGKMTPKITTTAKFLWLIYICMTAIEAILFVVFGMDFIDALSHAFSSMGTGGFSTRDGNIGSFNSVPIGVVCTLFMFLSGISFSVYYNILTHKFNDVRNNSELKAYIIIFALSVVFVTFSLLSYYGNFAKSLRVAFFHVASVLTTTGFVLEDYTLWPNSAQFFLFMLFFVGGCSGSTAGGVKVVRWVILLKQARNETKKLLHPQGIFTIKFNKKVVSKDVVPTVTSFVFVYFSLIIVTTGIGCLGDLDVFSSFTGAISMLGNVGTAFGQLGPGCSLEFLPLFVKWTYAFAMLAGRLELYTMIIFFLPEYWRNR